MIYVIRNADASIKTYSEKDDDVLVNGETRETFAGSMVEYAGRFELSVDKRTITADGFDVASVTLTTNTGETSIDVDVNGVTVTVAIVDGVGTLPGITAETPGSITAQPADTTTYCAAGVGSLTIEAVEVLQ